MSSRAHREGGRVRTHLRAMRLMAGLLAGITVVAGAATVGSGPSASGAERARTVDRPAAVVAFDTHDRVVSATPAPWTPHVKDGAVNDIAQVGNVMVVGGNFTRVSQTATSTEITRSGIFAFNASTGTISQTFNPTVLNGEVMTVEPGPSPDTVYVGGNFSSVNGVTRKLVLLSTTSGQTVSSFTAPSMNGMVRDVVVAGARLYVGGAFTTAGGQPHGGLVALNAASGARQTFVNVRVDREPQLHRPAGAAQGPVGAKAIAIDPDATTLAVIGNFRKADGLARDQMVLIDLTGASRPGAPGLANAAVRAGVLLGRLRQLHARHRRLAGRLLLQRDEHRRPEPRDALRHADPLDDDCHRRRRPARVDRRHRRRHAARRRPSAGPPSTSAATSAG